MPIILLRVWWDFHWPAPALYQRWSEGNPSHDIKTCSKQQTDQFQASIVTEAILAHDVHVLPWAPTPRLSGLRHVQARTGLLLLVCMGSGSAVALSGTNYWHLIIAVGGVWGLQHTEGKKIYFMWWTNAVFWMGCLNRHHSELWQK